jgi:hypothetical protein
VLEVANCVSLCMHFELAGEVFDCVDPTCVVIIVRLNIVVANFRSLQDNLFIMKLIFQVS